MRRLCPHDGEVLREVSGPGRVCRVPEEVRMVIGMEIDRVSKYFKDEGSHVFHSKRNVLQMWKRKFKSTPWYWIGIGGIHMNS